MDLDKNRQNINIYMVVYSIKLYIVNLVMTKIEINL